ncbi:MAG: tRNA lysidine(34) synthetase TilS [Rickettsiaceae bacterium]|nr:tRNA lysidine(34) synthetase TilS [Rickettsiaceae bacterium]
MHQQKFEIALLDIIGNAPPKVALAISGGADSVALLYLATQWAKNAQVKLVIFHVNHNLRKSSVEDAKFVEEITRSLNHNFYLFHWKEAASITSAAQEKARQARYDMMTIKCQELGIKLLMTAHHFDDVVENYLMRKKRGSGVFGLSYSNSYFVNDIHIVRPLLLFRKKSLLQYLNDNKYAWVEDETNISDKYERNRIRKQFNLFSDSKKQLVYDEIDQIQQEAKILNQDLIKFLAEFVHIDQMGFCVLQVKDYKNLLYDLQIQVLSYLFTIVSGKMTLPRFRNIAPIIEKIQHNTLVNCSLHGCLLIDINNNQLLICRERDQIAIEEYQLQRNLIWDNRFEINTKITHNDYKVTTVSHKDYLSIKDKLSLSFIKQKLKIPNKLILFTLPVIKNLEKIVAIPHISYYDEKILEGNLQIIFRPNFISRFTHFL